MALVRAKCLLLGDAMVGKTALTDVLESDGARFPKSYNMTGTTNLAIKTISIPDQDDKVELYIYDCPGKEAFRPLALAQGAFPSLVIIVYDVTNTTSFSNVQNWLEHARALRADVSGILVGNKADLQQRRAVSPADAISMAGQSGLAYFETSAKTVTGVTEAFQHLGVEYLRTFQEKLNGILAAV